MSTWKDLANNPRLKKIFDDRLAIIRATREFFWSQGFVEADTPIAQVAPSQEPYLNFFPVTTVHPQGQKYQMYLRTSPEFSLKKLLAAGYGKVFEIGKCFRNNEDFGGTHNPEFTMIEWYRSPGSYTDFMDDLEKLFAHIGKTIYGQTVGANGRSPLRYRGHAVSIAQPWDRLSMKQVWQKYLQINLDENLTTESLKATATKNGYTVTADDSYEDIFFKIFLNEIEPSLGLDRPLFIYDYPTIMTSLSRTCDHDPRYAERVECYVAGLEICNGFGELTDAAKQRKNLERDQALRKSLGKDTWPVDEDFIAALAALPADAPGGAPVGGIALGLDRVVILFTGAKDINEVIFGSVKDQLN